ncbi:hypothetical protein EniyanLRS_176 [Mycobacterium phage EniyanLRS]|uniref:Uncharacterized protein n=1 Tax=Mycobacterium phage EniyanLRS TaxID=1933770 RepID=A0A6B9LSJ1_9CAUD|nr:hypothetical protein EniyanLRS_176 [Mycobacterium phage EniyanLRS]
MGEASGHGKPLEEAAIRFRVSVGEFSQDYEAPTQRQSRPEDRTPRQTYELTVSYPSSGPQLAGGCIL